MPKKQKDTPEIEQLKKRVNSAPTVELKVADLVFDAEQPRTKIEQNKIESLGASLKTNGQLQNIVVRELDGKLVIVCGERRVRACKFIKQKTINGKILILTDEEVGELQMIENTQREDMSAMDEAAAFKKYYDKNMPLSEIADRFGKNVEFVRGRLTLNHLIPELQEAVEKEELTLDVAKEVACLGADSQQAIIPHIFENVADKLIQPSADDDDENENEEESEFEDFDGDGDDYENDETPFDDADDETPTETDEATVETPVSQVVYRRKSISLNKVRELITGRVLVNLEKAPFDLNDKRLHPEGLLCNGCPNRNGSNTLFDLGSGDENICLDVMCFQAKGSKLVQITREAHVSAKGEAVAAKTFTTTYYNNSPYKLPDTLTCNSFKKIAEKGEEVAEEKQCPNSEYAVCIDNTELAKVYLICADTDCPTHFTKYSYSSSQEAKPELTAEERSKNYQESRQKGVTRKTVEATRPVFFEQASGDYNALRWVFNDENLRFMMIHRFCELVMHEKLDDFIFACSNIGIKVFRSSWNMSAEEKKEGRSNAEFLSSYYGDEERTLEGDLRGLDEDQLSKLLFILTFVQNGRDYKNDPVKADEEMQNTAQILDEDYESVFAEKQVDAADNNRRPFAEKYRAELNAGIAVARPNLFTEYANFKNGTAQPLPSVKAVSPETATVEDEIINDEFLEIKDAIDDKPIEIEIEAETSNTVFEKAI